MLIRKVVVAACALAVTLSLAHRAALGQPAAGAEVTLAQAVEAAWRRARQAAETTALSRQAQAEQTASAAPWPSPPVVEFSHRTDRPGSGAGGRETEAGIAVPLWLAGQRTARREAAQAQEAVGVAAVHAGKLGIAGRVREALWTVALARRDLDLAAAQGDLLQALARDVERRVEAGDLARADALAARAEALAGSAAAAQARQALQAALTRWTALTGLAEVPAPEPVDDDPAASGLPPTHPALQWARLGTELARRRLDVARTSTRSAPEFVARLRQEVPGDAASAVNGVGFAVRWPLGTADRSEPLRAAALGELELAEAEEHQLRAQLEADLHDARDAARTAREQLTAERERAALLRERAHLVDRSFQAGETPLPDLLRALAAAAQAEATAGRQALAVGLAAARVRQALGVAP